MLAGILILPPLTFKPESAILTMPVVAPQALIEVAKGAVVIPEFPDYTQNPVWVAEQTKIADEKAKAEEAEKARLDAVEAAQAAYVAPVVQTTYIPIVQGLGTLIGSYGYAIGGNNCVDTAKAYGKYQPGNPITWYTTTHIPFIGAAALFPYNHVAVVVGIWSNGDVELVQSNYWGTQHRYSQSEIRGYF